METFPILSEDKSEILYVRNDCEKYCFEREDCWGCSISCHQQCAWNALEECKTPNYGNKSLLLGVSQKPSKKSIEMLLYSEQNYCKYANDILYLVYKNCIKFFIFFIASLH